MKNNKMLPIIIGVAVVVLGVGAYLLMGNKSVNAPSNETGVPETSNEEQIVAESFTGTLKEAVALGVGMRCTYSVEGNEYEGYVKGENYRGMMKNTDGEVVEVIVKDDCTWTWSQDQEQGMKICSNMAGEEMEVEEDETETEEVSIWDQQAGAGPDISYSCVPYAVTDAQFTPPTDVQFMDMESMMQEYGY